MMAPPSEPHPLPQSIQVDAAALSRLFSDTTTSYKYLWFHALLAELAATNFEPGEIELKSLLHRALTQAWYPKVFFRLAFGVQDKVERWFDDGFINIEGNINDEAVHKAVAQRITTAGDAGFLRYVPYRTLSPFFDTHIRGLPDHQKNAAIRRLADLHFNSNKPLYRFRSALAIQIHPDWLDYLATNFAIISGWSSWNWLQYLQQYNPNVPGIANKLSIPIQRRPLDVQRRFWHLAHRARPIECIYSGTSLRSTEISLDHFLPWSFVGHDQLWNLIPASQLANSAKNSRLPHESYIGKFIHTHHHAVCDTQATMSTSAWRKTVEPYLDGLHLASFDALLDSHAFEAAYRATISPMLLIAQRMGFRPGWQYSA
jgi:hypothetical protein